MNHPQGLHVVLGAGQIGTLLVDKLLARGLRVRQVRRSHGRGGNGTGAATVRPGVELRTGDMADARFAREALAGAAVVYHCLNPRYDRWDAELVPLTRGVLLGAASADARLVMLDNLYMYGVPKGAMREDSPHEPCSRKGVLRAYQHDEALAAHDRGDVRVAIARASDFFGPNVMNSVFGERFWRRVLVGDPIEVFGDPDQLHSYSYSHDVADGLLTLGGARDEAYGQVWHLPVLPAESTRAMILRVVAAPRLRFVPDWLLRTVGLFAPLLREVAEMTYQWRVPYVLDDTRFRAAFGAQPTPIDEQVRTTLAWARAAYGRAGAGAAVATSDLPDY